MMSEILKSIIERVTRYEWFTIFLPGVFLVLIKETFGISIIEVSGGWNLLLVAFCWGYVSYATGETIVEWAVKKFCPFAPYPEYIEWSATDKGSANMLVSNLNMFRSLTGMVLILFVLWLMDLLSPLMKDICWLQKLENKRLLVFVTCLGVIFVWSYIKQIRFIKGRIKKYSDDKAKKACSVKAT